MSKGGVTGRRRQLVRTNALALAVISCVGMNATATERSVRPVHPTAIDTPLPSQHPMATEGMRAFALGHYEEANEKLSSAMDSLGVPTMALYAARTNIQLNQWVKAAELYVLASRLGPRSSADIGQLQAQHEAEKERAELLARVPRLTIALEGDDLDNVDISLDSEPMPKALLGANQLVDPGHHSVTATRGGQRVTTEFDIGAFQHRTTTLRFAPKEPTNAQIQTLPSISTTTESVRPVPQASTAAQTIGQAAPARPMPTLIGAGQGSAGAAASATHTVDPIHPSEAQLRDRDDNNLQRNLGWTGIGLGAAGLLFGTTVGLLAVEKRSQMNSTGGCRDSRCYSDSAAEVDRYNAMRTWSTIGFVTGSLFGTTGLTLLLTAPKPVKPRPTTPEAPDLRLGIVPGAMALSGRF